MFPCSYPFLVCWPGFGGWGGSAAVGGFGGCGSGWGWAIAIIIVLFLILQ